MVDASILGPGAERRLRWVCVSDQLLLMLANVALRKPDQDFIVLPAPGLQLPDDVEVVQIRYHMERALHAMLCASKHWDRVPFGQRIPVLEVDSCEMKAIRLKINKEKPSGEVQRAV